MYKIGHGYDIHRLVENRALILGGVKIDYPLGLLGHSDADVLTHALIDALLGAAGLGDIGRMFSDQDVQFFNISSMVLLERAWHHVAKTYEIVNIDGTIIAEKPKLSPYITAIQNNLAKVLGIGSAQINLKAKTNEGLGEVGQGLAMQAHVVVMLKLK